MFVLLIGAASGASLDNLEVGGQWGTPTSTNPSAAWWNPAGLAAGGGHQVLIEASPTIGGMDYDRADPFGGLDEIRLSGVLPFAGISSDLGIEGLGLGMAMAVPMVRGGKELEEPGAGRYHLRQGNIQKLDFIFGGGYSWKDRIAVGAAAHLIDSSWSAVVDSATMPELYDALIDFGQSPDLGVYNDSNIENENYATTLDIGPLTDRAWTWGAGIQAKPHEDVTIGISYVSRVRLDHSGEATLYFSCPSNNPDDEMYDPIGRFGAESFDVCDTALSANATIGYWLPSRINVGVAWTGLERVRLEAMGGYVTWSDFSDFDLTIGDVAEKNDLENPDTAALVEQDRKWARDNEDSWFGGIDGKVRLSDRWMTGGRLLYDRAAVPDEAMSANNADANSLLVSGLLAFQPLKTLQLGASFTQHVTQTRTVTTSGFGINIDPDSRNEDRWFYPHGNGTYKIYFFRAGLSVKVALP